MEQCVTRPEFRKMLAQHKRRSLAQKIRHITQKWSKGKISAKEMLERESKLYKDLQKSVNKGKKDKIYICEY